MDLEKIKQRIRPDEKAVWKKAGVFLSKINAFIKKSKIKAIAVIGGSLAKGTFLKGDHDVDIFVKFPKEYETGRLSDILEKILKPLNPERVHGSRDYFIKTDKKMKYEIVPVYDIKNSGEIVNITDASPLHFQWLRKQEEENPELGDEIRLAKAFCKSAGVYGAESYIRGFSGHVLDILVVRYGSFMDFIRDAAKWKKPKIIDIYNVYRGEALRKLNRAKIMSPLVLIDPIQPDRNAAAAMSDEMFLRFIKRARAFLKKPSAQFFEREKFLLKKIKRKNVIILEVAPLSGKKDVVGSKLLHAFESIRKQLETNGFEISNSGWHWDEKAYFWFDLKKMKIPEEYVHEGPPVKAKNNVEQFREKYKKTFVKNSRIYARVDRKITDAKRMVQEILKIDFVRKNFRKARII
jgi:tRNA nucleotidyltransferase (CCA-adding enzyme)